MTWEDINAWCDELNSWIIGIGGQEEFTKAHPRGPFPLKADPSKGDDIEDSKDLLAYLTLWMCCQTKTEAPAGLHSRIILAGPFKGPWQVLYTRLLEKWKREDFNDIDIFSLAG
jgi:hypothetical protein